MLKKLFLFCFIAGTLATLIGLGAWQVQRLQWKNALIAQYEAARQMEPAALDTLPPDDMEAYHYRPVTLSGTLLHEQELHLGARRWYGKTGYHILVPLQLDGGGLVLVNRGWVPPELKEPEARRQNPAPQQVEGLRGIIRLPKPPALFTPANRPDKNFWFTVDIEAMAADIGAPLLPFTVELVDADHPRDVFPAPSDGMVVLRNDHLGYAITWFALALAAAVIFWLRMRKHSPLVGESKSRDR